MVDWFEIRNSTFDIGLSPDDGRKFTELYNGAVGDGATWTLDPQGSRAGERVINVQHLQSAQLDRVSRVCISTIQRLYSMLREFVFVFLKMCTAGCEQHEQTGIALCEWHKAQRPHVRDLASFRFRCCE